MSDNEQPKTKISTEYAPERLEELKENIEAVQKEIDDVWAQVQGQSESGTKVSSPLDVSSESLTDRFLLSPAKIGSRLETKAC
jgi:hypothetical protein